MAQTIRVYWSQLKGRVPLSFSLPGVIQTNSVIHIAASEAGSWNQKPDGTATVQRLAGAADVTVRAIAPKPDRVDFIIEVDWKSPLDIVTDITVMEPPTMYRQMSAVG